MYKCALTRATAACIRTYAESKRKEELMHSNDRNLFTLIENGIDIFLNAGAMVMAFILAVMFADPGAFRLESPYTLVSIFVTVLFQSFLFLAFNLYRPIPFVRTASVLWSIIKVNVAYFGMLELIALIMVREAERSFALIWILISAIISTAILVFKKRLIIHIAKILRRSHYNMRKVIIVGDNTATAQDFVKQVSENSQCGMLIVGYVGDKIHEDVGCDKLGAFKDLASILDEYKPDDVVFAIDAYDKRHLIRLVNMCDDRCIKVYFLPVIYGFFKAARQIETIGSLPIINIHSTPLDNRFNAFVKRVIDIIGSLTLILLTLPIMIAAAIGVRISSPGPIFFKQERVGKMGKKFTMLKFRSMKVNVGSQTTWSTSEDPRKTKFGNFLRMTSIDELPQLFNVLIGNMSLVGPRPEVPHFVEYFKDIIPLYMVKHYVKPGMTGLAQVLGLRGDTSVEDRIHKDIEYIENWSLGMDLAILFKTPFKAFNKQERYVEHKEDDGVEENERVEDMPQTEESVADVTPDIEAAAEDMPEDAPAAEENAGAEPDAEEAPEYKGKVLYAASTMSHINNFHLEYIEALRAEGYVVKVLARGDGADFNIPFEKKFFSSANTACRAEIKEILERERFDIILLNTSLAAFHIRLCLPKTDRPKVINMVHGYLFSDDIGFIKRKVLLFCERMLAKKTDTIIVMNEWDRRVAEKYKLASEVLFCRGMGATVREVTVSVDKLRREHSCQDKFVLCFVGELSDRKNQQFLVHALNEIKEKIPNAVLWLVGDGIGRDKLEGIAGRVDLSESVFLLGRRDNACDYMRACDLYVSASTIEGMPFNLIEAMGCGKTVLASRVKGHSDLIEDGKSGFLYKLDNMEEFVSKVLAFHDKEISLNSEDIAARYEDFAKKNVFNETLEIIKRSFS